MKVFHCDHCAQLLFFENTHCVQCERTVAYLPDLGVVGSLDPTEEVGVFTSPWPQASGRSYRLCANYIQHQVCNWAVDATGESSLCVSCQLTRTIPDLSRVGHLALWAKLENAKRRLIYTLAGLGLPVANKTDDPEGGLIFEFLADADPALPDAEKVLTGHNHGVITINIAEANDGERETRRVALGEPYRTLLGHLRHEVGHYYWNVLIDGTDRIEPFRELFGDERLDYGKALQAHYCNGPTADWTSRFVSGYASSHPWEDWAETWAHYLHIVDTLETAAACGLNLRPPRKGDPSLSTAPVPAGEKPFDRWIADWFPITYALNNLNRGMGLPDGYPFVLPPAAIEKLRFVHDTIHLTTGGAPTGF